VEVLAVARHPIELVDDDALDPTFVDGLKEPLRGRALEAFYAGDYPKAEAALEAAARLAPENPLVPGLLGQVRMRAGSGKRDAGMLFSAAVDLERSVILNPYNAGAWRDLERLYTAAGERRLLEGLLKRKKAVFK